ADGGLPWPLRAAHRWNERVFGAAFSPSRLAPEFPRNRAGEPRANGRHGRPAAGSAIGPVRAEQPGVPVRLFRPVEILTGLPRVEMTTEFQCVEGWSQVVTWGGVAFADFVRKLGTEAHRHPCVSLETADGAYYVGLDMPSARHAQTLLCDRMNGAPLSHDHGAPLRLVSVVKYGIKNIKWVGRIRFADERPRDFWAERGYDWYAGL
ncbi:MAG: molybdopterin-dependent oxidoreductase, partial [Zavarzinella sp.]|nr:molybdopterin-dependent oxidoreductase [Zavarzinella sp.]